MVQPQYSPEESLERVKLMMKYDTSKTLNENKKVIFEQDYLAPTAAATTAGAALGAGAVKTGLVAGTLTGGGAAGTATSIGLGLGATGTAAATLGFAVLGGAAALSLTPLVIWYMDKDNAKPKVERMVQYCTSDAAKIQKIERGLGDGEIRNLSDQLYDAMKGIGTDEEAVYGAFKSLKTVSDFCALVTRFNRDYGSEGDLLEWLDDDFDQTSEWMQIFRPLRDVVEDTLLAIKDEETPVPQPFVWNENCKIYKLGCKSDVIAKVQECLGGLVVDGKYGNKTAAKLKELDYNSFTDADVDKICNKQTPAAGTPTKPDEIEQVDADDSTDLLNN